MQRKRVLQSVLFAVLIILIIPVTTIAPSHMPSSTTSPTSPYPIRILDLGDSYTVGMGVTYDERFPIQLARRLQMNGYVVEEPYFYARSGWTTADLTRTIDHKHIDKTFNLVTLLVGTNNEYHGWPIETYRVDFIRLLNLAASYAIGGYPNIVVLSLPDWDISPSGKRHDPDQVHRDIIDEYNRINREETLLRGAYYVDVTRYSREVGGLPEAYASDGFHPSGIQYSGWVELALPIVWDVLDNPP